MDPAVGKHNDVIIVGAGLSGLTSAVKVLQKERSLQVKILEMTSFVGGQMAETRLGEIGAKWITEKQYHVLKLLQELKVPTRRRNILAPTCRRCWELDRGLFADLAKYELFRYIKELELRVHSFKPGRHDVHREYESMQRHICNRLFFNKSRKFMNDVVQLICGLDSSEINYDEFMRVCYTNGSLQVLFDLFLEYPTTLLEFSSRKLLQALMEELRPTEILLQRKVREIRHYKEYVEVYDSEQEIHTADAVILAIPWNSIDEILITPALPLEMRQPQRRSEKNKLMITSFLAKYNEGHWRRAGYTGNFFSHEPLVVGHEYRPTTYGGVTIHEPGFETLVRSLVLQTLAPYFGEGMLLPTEFHQHTFEMSSLKNVPFTTPWHRVVWSSSAAAATCYRGCLGGAVQSGIRGALNALLIVRPQTVSWQDIADLQVFKNVPKRHAGLLNMWLSTWNLYNVTYYSLFVSGSVTLIRYLYRYRYYS